MLRKNTNHELSPQGRYWDDEPYERGKGGGWGAYDVPLPPPSAAVGPPGPTPLTAPAAVLLEYMIESGPEAPPTWRGYRQLTSK